MLKTNRNKTQQWLEQAKIWNNMEIIDKIWVELKKMLGVI